MPKRKHHFVPKLYLKAFRSAPKRIHIYNLVHDKAIRDASLRDQCQSHRLYGDTDEVEDTLGTFESHTAPVLQKIVSNLYLPPFRTEEHLLLMFFIALQLTRTPLVAGRLGIFIDKMYKQVAKEFPGVASADLEAVRFGPDNPALISLSNAADIAYAISDLQLHLLCARRDLTFITSDNPAVKYNQYYEGFQGMGITGPLFRGIQIFLPLSPKRLLFLYDSSVYKVGSKGSNVISSVPDDDIANMNLLQATSAEQNLYFHDWSIEPEVRKRAQESLKHRQDDPTVVEEYEEVGNEETSSLIHAFERTPDLDMRLSFVRLRQRAQKISKSKWKYGIYRYRKPLPGQETDIVDSVPREIRTEIYVRK